MSISSSCVSLSTACLAVLLALPAPTTPLRAQGAVDRDDRDFAPGCADRWRDEEDDHDRRFCEVRETSFRASGGRLAVDGRDNGGVQVRGWDGDSVVVRAIVQTQASDSASAAALARQIRVRTDDGSVRAEGPPNVRNASWAVSFQLYVPRRTDLTIDTHNGPITVREVTGRMRLTAVNGPLVLDRVGGDVHGRTQNGPLTVTVGGGKWEGAGLDAETSNGPVTLTIPEKYAAHLVTGTVNGPMRVDFPMTLQGKIGRRIETDIGGGGPPIRAVTTNGPLVVKRRG